MGLPHALPPAKMLVLPETLRQGTEASIDKAIASLEQVIQDAHVKIQDLRTQRNATVPSVRRLPTEILAEIFMLFEYQHRQPLFAARKQVVQIHRFGRLVLTHVCRYWRTVARSLPHLWSHIPMSRSEEPIKTFLRLSKPVPLSILPIKEAYYEQPPLEVLSLLIPEAPRIRSLHMCLSTALLENISPDIWVAPLLESIALELVDDSPLAGDAPASIWGAALPALRSLSMTTFSCSFSRGFFRPTLTKLVIRHPGSSLSVTEWLDALEALPLLEHIFLDNATFTESLSGPISRRVEMAHLEHVGLRSEWYAAMTCIELLAHLSLPACRTLTLNKHTTTSDFHRLFSTVAHALGSAFAPQSASLQLDHTALLVRLWRAAPPLPAWKRSWGYDTKVPCEPERPAVALDIDALDVPLPPDLLPTLVSALPLSAMRMLRLWDGEAAHSVRPLAALCNVEALLYVCARPLELLGGLSGPSKPLLLPVLRHLTLRHAKWHVHGERCLTPYADPPLGEDIEAMLAARKKMGAPLEELHLQGLRRVDKTRDLPWLEEAKKDVGLFQWDTERWECSRPPYPCLDCAQRSVFSIGEPEGDIEGDLNSDVEFSDLE